MTTVLYLPLSDWTARRDERAGKVSVRIAEKEAGEIWAPTSAEGWSEYKEFAHLMLEMSRVVAAAKWNVLFLAELDGQAAGAGGLSIHEGVALFAGASTVPASRRQGVHSPHRPVAESCR
jgi:hypothetical protein